MCDHSETTIVPTPEGPHHAKEICAKCGRFMKWLPKPETLERQKANAAKIDGLKLNRELTFWERQFIGSVDLSRSKLSPKQQDILDKIAEKHFTCKTEPTFQEPQSRS